MNNQNQQTSFISKYAKIIVVIAVVCGATSGTLGKTITAPPIAIGFWRLTMALPFFGIPVFLKERNELTRFVIGKDSETRRGFIWTLLAGFFLFTHFFCWFSAVKNTNISSASILGSLHPIVVLIISILIYKKHIGIKPAAGIALAILGACLTAGLDYKNLTQGHLFGDIMAFLAAVFMGIYFAIGEKNREKTSGNVYVFILFLSCWFCFLMAMLISKTAFFIYPPKDYILLALMALICQIGSHAMFNLCLGYVDSVYVSAWETGDSIFSTLFALLFLGQTPTAWAIIGCALVVIGLLYYNSHYNARYNRADNPNS